MCWFYHKWNKWRTPEPGQKRVDGVLVYKIWIQRRICSRCGKEQVRHAV